MRIQVKVIANAAKDEIIQKAIDKFLVKITTARAKGKANKKLIALLASYFRVRKSDVVIERGEKKAYKSISIRLGN